VVKLKEGKMMQTVFALEPISDGAKSWVNENVHYEPYQMLGNSIVVEHRFIADITAGLIEAGFIPNKDFRIS